MDFKLLRILKESRKEGNNERRKEGKKERRKDGKKERRKEGKKERRKEGKKERRKVSKERQIFDLECGPAQPSLFYNLSRLNKSLNKIPIRRRGESWWIYTF